MHVLIVGVSRCSAPSGVCRYTDMIGRALSHSGHAQTTIAIGSWQECYFRGIFRTYSHSQIVNIGIRNTALSRNAWTMRKLPEIADRLRADVVHLAYPMPLLRRRFPCPVVATVHDLYAFDAPRNFSFPLANKVFFKLCMDQSDAVICISRNTLHRLRQLLPNIEKKRIVAQVYNPIAIPDLLPGQQSVHSLQHSRFILAVGQHRSNKNLDILQRSFAGLRSAHKISEDCQLVIVGSEGPETPALHALTEGLGLGTHVMYLSSISESELAWLYRNCLVLVVPSSNEGFCMPLVEALLSDAQVVCADIPVLREVGVDTCTYFQLQPNAVQALSDAIIKAISSATHRHLLRNPFTPAHAAQELLKVYHAAMSTTTIASAEALVS